MITVTMDVFSGRPNPAWHLSPKESDELLARVLDGNIPLTDLASGAPRLGYRGMIVEFEGDSAQEAERLDLPNSFRISADSKLQQSIELLGETEGWLLGGKSNHVEDDVLEHAAGVMDGRSFVVERPDDLIDEADGEELLEDSYEIDDNPPGAPQSKGAGPVITDHLQAGACSIRVTSNNNFDFWNKDINHRLNNNCYNYASNLRNNAFGQPGAASTGKAFWKNANNCFDPNRMDAWFSKQGCLNDGWTTWCGYSSYKIGLVIWHKRDFHFYRRVKSDNNGQRWAHKAGQTAATNKDNSGKLIRNPWACDRGPYTVWSDYLYHRADRGRSVAGDTANC